MDRITVPTDCLVLVCDGSKAVFYRNAGTAVAITLVAVSTMEEHHPRSHELGTDRPGRSYDSSSPSRSAVEQTDLHRRAEEQFILAVAARLAQLVVARPSRPLIIAAPPHVLGVLRPQLTPEVTEVLRAEIARDFVKTPKHKLEHQLLELS